jgi:hypothetical protein
MSLCNSKRIDLFEAFVSTPQLIVKFTVVLTQIQLALCLRIILYLVLN